jgi:hypothetical protein
VQCNELFKNLSESRSVCNDESSNQFKIVTGVKLVGILYPFLLYVFVYDFLGEILKLNIGAKIGNTSMNILNYCNDLN